MYALYASDRNGVVEKGEGLEIDFLNSIFTLQDLKQKFKDIVNFCYNQKSSVYISLQNFDHYMINVIEFYQSNITSKGAY